MLHQPSPTNKKKHHIPKSSFHSDSDSKNLKKKTKRSVKLYQWFHQWAYVGSTSVGLHNGGIIWSTSLPEPDRTVFQFFTPDPWGNDPIWRIFFSFSSLFFFTNLTPTKLAIEKYQLAEALHGYFNGHWWRCRKRDQPCWRNPLVRKLDRCGTDSPLVSAFVKWLPACNKNIACNIYIYIKIQRRNSKDSGVKHSMIDTW